VRFGWDPHPTFTSMLAWKPDATPEYVAACKQRMRDLYAEYARSLDAHHPMWHFEILAVNQPPHELVALAQARRDLEGQS
jgi:hypothetical protein